MAESSIPFFENPKFFPHAALKLLDKSQVLRRHHKTKQIYEITTKINDFIAFVEQVEQKYTEAEQRNTSFMITQFRKVFYDSEKWNTILIPDTNHNHLKSKISPADKNGFKARKLIRLSDETIVDFGHVITGLDACNHQGDIINPLFAYWIKISKTLDAATWLGDIASIISYVRSDLKTLKEKYEDFTEDELINIWINQIQNNSNASDLLGDIDGVVMGLNLMINSTQNGKKVSEILSDYYLQKNNITLINNRFKLFAHAIGLGAFDGKHFENESAFLIQYQHEITDTALLVTAVNFGKMKFIEASLSKKNNDPLLNKSFGLLVLKAFIEVLKEHINA